MSDNMPDDLTKVEARETKIKVFTPYPDSEDRVFETKIAGKLTIPEAKEYVKAQYPEGSVMVSKVNIKNTFRVSTLELLQLKHY